MISGADGAIMPRLSLSAGPRPPSLPAQTAAAIFGELEGLSTKVVMRKLSRGVVRRGRSSSTKGSVVGAAAGLKTKPRKGEVAGDGEWSGGHGGLRHVGLHGMCAPCNDLWGCMAGVRPAMTIGPPAILSPTGAGQLSEATQRALEALRQEWIAQEVQKNQPALPGSGAAVAKG